MHYSDSREEKQLKEKRRYKEANGKTGVASDMHSYTAGAAEDQVPVDKIPPITCSLEIQKTVLAGKTKMAIGFL